MAILRPLPRGGVKIARGCTLPKYKSRNEKAHYPAWHRQMSSRAHGGPWDGHNVAFHGSTLKLRIGGAVGRYVWDSGIGFKWEDGG